METLTSSSCASCCLNPPHRGAFGAAVNAIAAWIDLGLSARGEHLLSISLYRERVVVYWAIWEI